MEPGIEMEQGIEIECQATMPAPKPMELEFVIRLSDPASVDFADPYYEERITITADLKSLRLMVEHGKAQYAVSGIATRMIDAELRVQWPD